MGNLITTLISRSNVSHVLVIVQAPEAEMPGFIGSSFQCMVPGSTVVLVYEDSTIQSFANDLRFWEVVDYSHKVIVDFQLVEIISFRPTPTGATLDSPSQETTQYAPIAAQRSSMPHH